MLSQLPTHTFVYYHTLPRARFRLPLKTPKQQQSCRTPTQTQQQYYRILTLDTEEVATQYMVARRESGIAGVVCRWGLDPICGGRTVVGYGAGIIMRCRFSASHRAASS